MFPFPSALRKTEICQRSRVSKKKMQHRHHHYNEPERDQHRLSFSGNGNHVEVVWLGLSTIYCIYVCVLLCLSGHVSPSLVYWLCWNLLYPFSCISFSIPFDLLFHNINCVYQQVIEPETNPFGTGAVYKLFLAFCETTYF